MQFAQLRESGRRLGYKAISRSIIEAIESGRLSDKSPLPTTRELADILAVSRDTIVRCYRHLQSLSYIETRGALGTFVRVPNSLLSTDEADATENGASDPAGPNISRYGMAIVESAEPYSIAPDFPSLNYGGIPAHCLPLKRWREHMQERVLQASVRSLHYEREVMGRDELRQALSSYLNRGKGLKCHPADIVIFNVTFYANSLLCRLLLNPGDVIAVEEPGFNGIKNLALFEGFEIYPVPLDHDGLSIQALSQSLKPVRLIYTMPNHQEPTGLTMSMHRRKQLLAWAEKNNAWIIEDEFDSFFHYGKPELPTLKSMDRSGRVIYFGTFWQLLYPLTTLCFMVPPPAILPLLGKSKVQTEGITEPTVQLAVSDLLETGFLQRHVRRLERQFAAKRRSLMYEFKRVFGDKVRVSRVTGGTTILISFSDFTEELLAKTAAAVGLPLLTTRYFYYGENYPAREFVVYFPGFTDDREVRRIVEAFYAGLA
jgi:GntR family transcriptional regulator/MocR family aminotransferase